MPEAQATLPPAPEAPTVPEDLSAHLSTLIDAMRQLAESHKTLLETVRTGKSPGSAVQGSGKEGPAPAPTDANISGDPGSGQKPGTVVDYSRLSPLQSITLGLRDTRAGAD
jgi:hypothetical protein